MTDPAVEALVERYPELRQFKTRAEAEQARCARLAMLLDLLRERMKARKEVRRDTLNRWIADIDFALSDTAQQGQSDG